ncbi:hypothetical protein [Streptomyces sp. NPDC050534]|uniref:hypothetical protein n=1 Tax=Streptomyces sp. NPDC050534 TaxID=3365625 RepID=UPI0037A83EC5
MGLFSPKYPKSDTPAPAARSGLTDDQLRGRAMHEGGVLDKGSKTAVIRVDEWDKHARITTQRYVKRSDGTWVED